MDFKIYTGNKIMCYDYFNFFNEIKLKNLEQYYKYLCDLILESNYNKAIINLDNVNGADKLEKKYYNDIYYFHHGPNSSFHTHYVYDIADKESKEILIKNITFCLQDNNGNIVPVDCNKKYISNNENLKDKVITLLMDDTIVLTIRLFGGRVNDWRDWNEIRNQKSELSGLRYNPKIAEFGLYRSHGEEYRYSALFDDLVVDYSKGIDKDSDLLWDNHYGRDKGKLEQYLDFFRDYLFDLIDECDHFVVEKFEIRERDYYAQFLKYEVYDDVVYNGASKQLMYSSRVYDITSKEDREKFKKIFTFNVADTNNEYLELHVNRKYFLNDEKDYKQSTGIHFIKAGKELFYLTTNSGFLTDYREHSVIKAHQEKYSKIAKDRNK